MTEAAKPPPAAGSTAENEARVARQFKKSQDRACWYFATILPRYLELPRELRDVVVETAAIVGSPAVDPDTLALSLATIREALFPSKPDQPGGETRP
jgi:hypothetical protein